jgi:hypothetical protein
MRRPLNTTFYQSTSVGTWWTADVAGHADSALNVYQEQAACSGSLTQMSMETILRECGKAQSADSSRGPNCTGDACTRPWISSRRRSRQHRRGRKRHGSRRRCGR